MSPAREAFITARSPDRAPWAEDPSQFRIDLHDSRCINFVKSADDDRNGPFPTVVAPWPVLDIVGGGEKPGSYSKYFPLSKSDTGDSESMTSGSGSAISSTTLCDSTGAGSPLDSASPPPQTPSDAMDTPDEIAEPSKLPEIMKLEETIPFEFLPDILVVHDPEGKTQYPEFDTPPRESTRYKRVFPRRRDHHSRHGSSRSSEAFLDFSDAESIGSGNHSRVFRARFRLPPPLTTKSPESSGQVFVAAKLCLSDSYSYRMLSHEAKMYSSNIPSFFTKDWTGYHFISEAMYDGYGVVPVAAVVPKFYGLYIPERSSHRGFLSPIMLMEECGRPIDRETLLSNERELIYSFVVRLHRVGICQGSFKCVNVLKQPGPLSVEPAQRSLDTASFRLIDFGRAEMYEDLSGREWREICGEQMDDMKDDIYGQKREMTDPISGRKHFTRRFLTSSVGLV